jgi:hypothetical protein
MTNSPKLAVKAMTFKIGSTWGTYTTWPSLGRVYGNYGSFYTSSGGVVNGRYDLNIQTSSTAGTVAFQGILFDGGAVSVGVRLTVASLQANYANRWLGMVSATSDTSSTFANWTGGSLTASNWCQRTIVVDIASQTIIGQMDEVSPALGPTIPTLDFTTQQYELFGSNNATYFRWNSYLMDGMTGFDSTPWSKISDWLTVGNTFDPVTYWPSIVGETPQGTVAGAKAWFSTTSTGVGTSVTFVGSPGYRINVTADTRQPAGVYQYILNPYATTPAPVYTEFTGY